MRIFLIDLLKIFGGLLMIIKRVKLKNIRSYKECEVNFSEGSTLLWGDVGSGKTSILLAIEFGLFGLQPGQRGSSLLRNGESDGRVELEFKVDDKNVLIERSLKKGSKTITQDYCAITVNGEKKEFSVTELKNSVLELLNYPKEFSKKLNLLYKFTVYTPQEEMKQIILQDSETRINTLRHVFGIDKYKRILENSSLIASKLREEKRLNEGIVVNFESEKEGLIVKEKELAEKKYNLILLESEFEERKIKKKLALEDKEKISVEIEEKNKLLQEIEKTKIMINNKQDSILTNQRFLPELENQIIELSSLKFDESKIEELENKIKINKDEREKINLKRIEITSKIGSLNLKNDDLKKLEIKLSNLEVCPTCLQNVDAIYRANVMNKAHNDSSTNNQEIEKFELELKELLKKIPLIDMEIYGKEKEIDNFKVLKIKLQSLDEKQKRLDEVKNANILLEKDVELLKNHNSSLNRSFEEASKFDLIFREKEKLLEEATRLERIAEIKFAELKKEIEVFDRNILEIKTKLLKMENVKNRLNYISEIENWISKKFVSLISYVEKNVMIKLKSEFSKVFAEWFNMLVSESFNVYLKDDFTPVIEQQDYEIDYAYLSGGERTAIALAYRLALNQVINSLLSKIKTRELVILDEPTDGFSDKQVDKIREVLEQLDTKQLIVVSHEQKIEGFVENVIKFQKDGGVSGVVE